MVNIEALGNFSKCLVFKQDNTVVDQQKTIFQNLYLLVFFQLVVDKMSADNGSHELKSSFHHGSNVVNVGYVD